MVLCYRIDRILSEDTVTLRIEDDPDDVIGCDL